MRGVRAKKLRKLAYATATAPDGAVISVVRSTAQMIETKEGAEAVRGIWGNVVYTAEEARSMGFAVADKYGFVACKHGPDIHPEGTGRRQYRILKRSLKRAKGYTNVSRA